MIIGSHFLLHSRDAEADRAFFRDVLGFRWVDAGEGWLIFALSPAEMGIHPMENDAADGLLGGTLYLMCDDLDQQMALLRSKNVECGEVQTAGWGRTTTISLPSGGRVGLYQPRHRTALDVK